jgi:PIN domain nuclease of toxin-antitoxin system
MIIVLDTSAIIAVIRGEAGRERVVRALGGAIVSTVNAAEVLGNLVMRGMPIALAKVEFDGLGVPTVPFDDDQALEAGNLRRLSHHLQLSLADRACLALARLRKLPVLTSDRKWSQLNIGVEVRQIR